MFHCHCLNILDVTEWGGADPSRSWTPGLSQELPRRIKILIDVTMAEDLSLKKQVMWISATINYGPYCLDVPPNSPN